MRSICGGAYCKDKGLLIHLETVSDGLEKVYVSFLFILLTEFEDALIRRNKRFLFSWRGMTSEDLLHERISPSLYGLQAGFPGSTMMITPSYDDDHLPQTSAEGSNPPKSIGQPVLYVTIFWSKYIFS